MLKFLVLFLFAHISCANIVPFITKCKWDDSKCLKSSTQNAIAVFAKGIPELGVQSLDPIHMESLDASSGNLKLYLKDISGTGLKDSIVKKVVRDVEKSKLFVKLQCTVDFKGHYNMNGSLLFLPIEGNGAARVILRKIIISVEADLGERIGEDGLKRWTIKDFEHSYQLKDKATIQLENLFNGNEVLSRAAYELIESSSNEIVLEVGPPIVKAIVQKIVENVQNFFDNVPADELEQL